MKVFHSNLVPACSFTCKFTDSSSHFNALNLGRLDWLSPKPTPLKHMELQVPGPHWGSLAQGAPTAHALPKSNKFSLEFQSLKRRSMKGSFLRVSRPGPNFCPPSQGVRIPLQSCTTPNVRRREQFCHLLWNSSFRSHRKRFGLEDI